MLRTYKFLDFFYLGSLHDMSNTLRYPVLRTEVCHAIMESNEVGPVEAKIRCLTDLSDAGCQGRQERKIMQHIVSISSRYHQLVFQAIKPNCSVCPVALDTRAIFKFEDSKS